jgi:hypothetical protein
MATLGAGQQVPVAGAHGRGRRTLVTAGGLGPVAGQGGYHRADLLVAGGQQEGGGAAVALHAHDHIAGFGLGELGDPVGGHGAAGVHQEHAPDLLASPLVGEAQEARAVMSTINRNSGTHQPESTGQASTGSAHDHAGGPCQRFARNCATRNLTSPHDPTLGSASHLLGCVDRRGGAWRREPPEHQWHARGQGFKSPQLHHRSDGLCAVYRPEIPGARGAHAL